MIQNLEITTIDLDQQEYALLTIHPNEIDYTIVHPGLDFPLEFPLVKETYTEFKETGLLCAIKRDLRRIDQTPQPEGLRLIHQIYSTKQEPILRISPIGEDRICISDYFLEHLDPPLQSISMSSELGGCVTFKTGGFFRGSTIFLTMTDSEKHHEHYFGRNLKETRRLR